MAGKLIQSSVVLFAVSALLGAVGCSCHKSTCYDGDCGLVYDNDYWEGDGGGCGAPSGHASGCGGCGGPAAHSGCSLPQGVSGGCGDPHHQHGPTCSSCGGVHTVPSQVTTQPGCPHCGVDHGPATEGAPPAEPAPPAKGGAAGGTTASPPPPPLPPTIPENPGDTAPAKAVTGQVPLPLQAIPATQGGVPEPAPPVQPVEVPLPTLEKPAPIPRDATQPKWIPRRL